MTVNCKILKLNVSMFPPGCRMLYVKFTGVYIMSEVFLTTLQQVLLGYQASAGCNRSHPAAHSTNG